MLYIFLFFCQNVAAQNGQNTSYLTYNFDLKTSRMPSTSSGRPTDTIFCVCVCFVRCSVGQFGLWEDLRVVQCGGIGQSNRHRAEPGQRRGAESCSQILSGGQIHAAIISLPLKASGCDVSRAKKKNRFHSGRRRRAEPWASADASKNPKINC